MMLNNRLKQAFLVLLRQGLWGRKEVETNLFPLTPDEWMQIYNMTVKQTLQGIVYDGIQLLPKEQQPPRSLFMQWTVVIDQLERMNRQQNALLEVLPRLFGQEPAIPYQVLKGQGIAASYPNPLHRVCGDIDLYFGDTSLFQKANQRVEKIGIPMTYNVKGDASYALNGIEIEHHQYLIDLYRPSLRKKINAWEREMFPKGQQTPSPLANHLLQSTHILKHLVKEGIGLRQLCDLAMTMKTQMSAIDKQELEEICRDWKIFHWHQVLYALLVKYFSLPPELVPFPSAVNPDQLMEEIWKTGNFGHGDERFGKRPDNFWKGKTHTIRVILSKWELSLRYAPSEICWFMMDLTKKRLKELFTYESN